MTKSKSNKKFVSLILAAVLSFSLAVPAMAAETAQPRTNVYVRYYIQSLSAQDFLTASNINGTRVFHSNTRVSWMLGRYGSTIKMYLGDSVGNSQLVLRYDGGSVKLANETYSDGDTRVTCPQVGGDIYRILFSDRNAYINAIDNHELQTSWSNSSNAQKWSFATM